MIEPTRLLLELPAWVSDVAPRGIYPAEEARMAIAVALARHNVTTRNGGPFGAAVFEQKSGRLVAAGVNLVLPMRNSILHAEIVAIMVAEMNVGTHTLSGEDGVTHELVTSCEPCAMCLGAVHWSGVRRLVTGATREDVEAIQFDEGPVFPESYQYLERRGLEIRREVLRAEAREVLQLYAATSGEMY
jgi:tRNA(Arg) A34 adenosine deaminase TadA